MPRCCKSDSASICGQCLPSPAVATRWIERLRRGRLLIRDAPGRLATGAVILGESLVAGDDMFLADKRFRLAGRADGGVARRWRATRRHWGRTLECSDSKPVR